MIYLTHEDANREIAFARTLHNGRVDGALISVSGTANDFSHFRELQAKGLPIVFFDRVVEDFDTIKVTTDDFESAYLATKHLIERGCKRIAHLGISKNLSIGKKRLNGYVKALADHNMAADDTLIAACTNDNTKDFEIISNLFTEHNADGIFASVERYAILTYEVCRSLKLNIPDDVKVISFSNLQTASLLNPSLSTITQPAFDMGKEAVTMLLKALEKKNFQLKDENIVIKSSLTERESTMR